MDELMAPAEADRGIMSLSLQMGVTKQLVSIDRSQPNIHVFDTLKQFAFELARSTGTNNESTAHLSADQLFMFVHDYTSPNMLKLLSDVSQLTNGGVIEVVLSSLHTKPALPHVVEIHNYVSPTFCNFCGEMLVGLIKQGLKCSKCTLNYHKRCVFAPFNNCTAASATDAEQVSGQAAAQALAPAPFGLPHTFVVHSYNRPTVCKYCDKLLVGIIKQGLQCRDCKVNVHKKCAGCLENDCRPTDPSGLAPTVSSPVPMHQEVHMTETVAALEQLNPADQSLDQQQMIQLQRLPGGAAQLQPRKPSVIREGWQLHFTNYQPDRRLRHYWVLESNVLSMYNEGMHRCYKQIQLAQILGVHSYTGPPLDTRLPPHCFEIQTQDTIYYVGENLDWYKQAGQASDQPPVSKLPRRESGVGLASSQKWFECLSKALLPPTRAREMAIAEPAIEFSSIYQVNPAQELGSGQFGTVYGAVNRQTGTEVAVKVIAKERFGRKQQSQLFSEVTILQQVGHPGIIKLLGMYETKDKIFVVMEKMAADMLEMILSSRMGRLSERHTKYLILQILHALKYLHSKGIAHCDLKPENVLLSQSDTDFPRTKLCDFGYARFIDESQFRNTMVGTPAYLAPEVLQKKGYNKSLDMWAVGVVIYVTMSGTFPFNEGEEIEDQIRSADWMFPATPWAEVSKEAVEVIQGLLKVDIESRYTNEQCLNHKWLDDAQLYVDCRRLEQRFGGDRYLTTPADDQKFGAAAAQLLAAEDEQSQQLIATPSNSIQPATVTPSSALINTPSLMD